MVHGLAVLLDAGAQAILETAHIEVHYITIIALTQIITTISLSQLYAFYYRHDSPINTMMASRAVNSVWTIPK